MNSAEIVEKVKAGTHRLVKSKGSKKFTLERRRPSTGEWLIGMRVNANSAKAAAKLLTFSAGDFFDFWS